MKGRLSNADLHQANRAKKDEFYTQLADIESELKHYTDKFRGKVVFCNCDDPKESNFVKYFSMKFEELGLKKLVATHYKEAGLFTEEPPYKLEYTGDKNGNRIPDPNEFMTAMISDGDFRSKECVELLKEADIVVTNPPFSLFREYIGQLMEYNKKFLIIGNINAFTYKECFQYIKNNKMWLGASIHSGDREFRVPNDYPLNAAGYRVDNLGNKYIRVKGVRWFTNLDYKERHKNIDLYKKYTPEEYPKYDYYDAINVNKTADIPKDYTAAMGVPITFMDKYNPEQFEILSSNDIRKGNDVPFKQHGLIKDKDGAINGKPTYVRIVIRNKKAKNGNKTT